MPHQRHLLFRWAWRTVNFLLTVAMAASVYGGAREYAVRKYLRGFADAVVPQAASPERKAEAILIWMRNGPPRNVAADPSSLSPRDPETTLNYDQLLKVCGTATNAFVNLARSGGLNARRLLLLTPEWTTKHVVAEVRVDGRWVIADPAFRVLLRNAHGQLLTRGELQNRAVFAEAISSVPGYPVEDDYARFAHVRLARLSMGGRGLQRMMQSMWPGWDEALDWSLLLERQSFFFLVISMGLAVLFLALRISLASYADRRPGVARYHLREHVWRAGVAFFSTPEIEQ